MIKKIFFTAILLIAIPLIASDVILPALTGPVVDTAGVLTREQVMKLSLKSREFEKAKGSQIAVCIVPTVQPLPIEDFGIKLAEKWKIGRAKISDGIIIIIAKNDRKMRIEVGRGLEGIITDLKAGRIITQIMAPEFRKGDFFKGIDSAMDTIITLINGGDVPAVSASYASAKKTDDNTNTGAGIACIVAAIVFFILFFVMKKVLKPIIMMLLSWIMTASALHLLGMNSIGETIGISSIIMLPLAITAFVLKFAPGGSGGGGYYSSGDSSYSSYSSSDSSSYSSSSSDSYSGGGGDYGGGGSSGDW
jgi:uncharacterized protein